MAVTVGAVYVDVLPSARDFVSDLVAEILPDADKAGEKIGRKLGEALGREAGKRAKEGIEDALDDVDTTASGAKKGKQSGGAFARSFKAEVEAALRSLPDIDIESDPAGALADIALIREQLRELSDKKVGVDITAEDALRKVAELRAELQAIQDRDIDVDFDVRGAIGSLGQLEDRLTRTFQDRQGHFARDLRASIDRAVRALPDIEIDADTTEAQREIHTIRALLEEIGRKRIDIDISTPDLLAELAQIEAMLATLEGPHDIRVQADLAAARAALARFAENAGDEGERSGGAFMRRLRAELAKLAGTLPDVRIDADTSPALIEVATLRARLAVLSANIGVDVDGAAALAEIANLKALAESLDRDDIDIDVRVDLRGVIAELAALAAAAKVAEAAVDDAVGTKAVGRVSRFRLILALVAALLPIIAAAVVALPAAFAAIVGPTLAIAAGVDGIKRSFAELKPEIDAVRETTSQAFEQSLEPTIERLHVAIPRLQDDLAETAFAVSEVANQIVTLATSGENLSAIETNFSLIDAAILNAIPGLQLLTQNIITLTTIGLRGMVGFGEEMRQVGEAWAGVIARLQASGAAEAAVRSLFQVLAELLGLIAGLTEFGAVLAATFGPALASAISGLTAIFSTFAGAIDSLWGPLQTVAAAATTVGLVMLILGGRITAAAVAMRTGLVTAATSVAATFTAAYARVVALGASITGLGIASRIAAPALGVLAAAARTLWIAVGGPVGAAITAIIVVLSALGAEQGKAAAAADQHRVAVQELADALRASGGIIDSNVILLTRQNVEAAGATAAMDQLGISMAEVTNAVSMGGPSYDRLIAHLQGIVKEGTNTRVTANTVHTSLTDQAKAAQGLIEQLSGLRGGFEQAAEQNRRLGEALFQAGNSMVSGAANAKALEEAHNTLADAMSSVDDRAKALYISVIQLSGQALPLGLAQGALGQATREVAKAFDEFGVATKESGDSLLDNTGKINVASEAGYKLTQAVEGQVKAMTDSATAAFEAAGGMNNIEAASAAAARQVQFTRDRFIEQATQMGLTGAQAAELADSYGLIPSLVVTQLQATGIPQVNQDILQINQLLRGLPPNTTVNIGVPAQETIAQLQSIGAEIVRLPDGTFTITLNDQPALDRFNGLVNTIEHPPAPPQAPVGLNPTQAQQDAKNLLNQINTGAPAQAPVGINPAPAEQQLPQVQQGIESQPPANQPLGLDTTNVPPQIGQVQQQVLGTVATMPINPIKGSGWDVDLAGIRDSVVMTVAAMPIDAVKSVNFDAQIQFMRTTLGQGIAATLPIDPVMSPNWGIALQAIKDSLGLPPYPALLITVARAPTWAIDLAAITGPLSLPPYTTLFLTVARAPTWAIDLAAITGPLMLPPYTALLITVMKAPTFDLDLQLIKDSLALPPHPALLITVARAPTWPVDLAAIVGPLQLPPYTALFITVMRAPTWAIDLAAIVGPLQLPPYTALLLTVAAAPTLAVDLQALHLAIAATPAVIPVTVDVNPALLVLIQFMAEIQASVTWFQVTADVNPAILVLIDILAAIQQVVTFFSVTADTAPAQQAVIDLVNWIASLVVPITVVAQFGGFGGMGGGFAEGGVAPGGGGSPRRNTMPTRQPVPPGTVLEIARGAAVMGMAGGGQVGTPMSAGIAAVVPPNTWRVIGDRIRDDEAYIPINSATRSHSILAYTAARMGYRLSPQQSGSYMTQQARSYQADVSVLGEGGSWTQRQAPLIGQVVASPDASATDLADEVMFRLRVSEYGGVNGVRR